MIKNFKLNRGSFKSLGNMLAKILKSDKAYSVSVTEWDRRSLSANSVYHVWISAISDHTGEDIKTVTGRLKRDFGLPIVLSGKDGWIINSALEEKDYYDMQDNEQVKFIVDIPMTRLFTPKQHNQYRDNIQSFWNQNGLFLDYEK